MLRLFWQRSPTPLYLTRSFLFSFLSVNVVQRHSSALASLVLLFVSVHGIQRRSTSLAFLALLVLNDSFLQSIGSRQSGKQDPFGAPSSPSRSGTAGPARGSARASVRSSGAFAADPFAPQQPGQLAPMGEYFEQLSREHGREKRAWRRHAVRGSNVRDGESELVKRRKREGKDRAIVRKKERNKRGKERGPCVRM